MSREKLYSKPLHEMTKSELRDFMDFLVEQRLSNMNSGTSTVEIVALLNIAAAERNARSSGVIAKTAIALSVIAILISAGILATGLGLLSL